MVRVALTARVATDVAGAARVYAVGGVKLQRCCPADPAGAARHDRHLVAPFHGRRASLMVTLRARTLDLSTARPARSVHAARKVKRRTSARKVAPRKAKRGSQGQARLRHPHGPANGPRSPGDAPTTSIG